MLVIEDLRTHFQIDAGLVKAVDGVSFELDRGKTLGIVGESGSGKTVLARSIMRLNTGSNVITTGSIRFNGEELIERSAKQMQKVWGLEMAMVFQDPMTSLNPVVKVGRQLTEHLRYHLKLSKSDARATVVELLRSVKIPEPESRFDNYPHEMSGGMRQRVSIAIALACGPKMLFADEPTTALDVTVQREILDLLRELQASLGTAIILITHDMGVVAEMADRVIVMKAGRAIEEAPARTLFASPREAYTRALLAAVPRMGAGDGAPQAPSRDAPVARLSDVRVTFDLRRGFLGGVTHRIHAVEGVTFDIRAGETFALVGESGCGKSSVARAMAGLTPFEGGIEINARRLGAPGTDPRARHAGRLPAPALRTAV